MFYIEDLGRSKLELRDMDVRPLGWAERAALDLHQNIQGFVIPYFNIKGEPIPYYRARLQDTSTKYKQPRGSNNAVYFPKKFLEVLNGHKYVLITEGEKKAAKAVKHGIPCVGLGGIYSWRNNTATLPANALEVKQHKAGAVDIGVGSVGQLKLRLSDVDVDAMFNEYATGFSDLVELVKLNKLTVVICFDSSYQGIINNCMTVDVQRAAARLGIELRHLQIPLVQIKHLMLPLGNHPKMGVDDFIVEYGEEQLIALIEDITKQPRAFPAHPDIYSFVNKKLQFGKVTRKDIAQLGITIVSDLDSKGKRLRTIPNDDIFYFDNDSKKMMTITSASMRTGSSGGNSGGTGSIMFDKFRDLLYKNYGLMATDSRIMAALTTQLSSESPIDEVVTRKGTFSLGDTIYHQINAKQYITCDADSPLTVHYNGDNGVLFESSAVDDTLDAVALQREVERQLQQPLKPWWLETLAQTRIKDTTEGYTKRLAALLFYTSPWLFRWRGTQLPVEFITGEAGSGKSTLYSLRLNILTGREELKNRPQSLKDWHASILGGAGLHVIDNANLDSDPSLCQSISDEMARMVTEPEPAVEMRKYYTESGLIRVPSRVIFALTAIKLPFRQVDLMQRAIHVQLERGIGKEGYVFDSEWKTHQLTNKGGRIAWLAHHLIVLHKFLHLVKQGEWDNHYKASYRLINFEQILRIMARIFGWDDAWVPNHLNAATQKSTLDSDWLMQGLKAFAEEKEALHGDRLDSYTFTAQAISDWASMHDIYRDCSPLIKASSVQRHIASSAAMVAAVCRIVSAGSNLGAQTYRIQKASEMRPDAKNSFDNASF